MNVKEIKSKTILVKSNLPEADYVINCYTGCLFGCSYCYASFMGRFVGEDISSWGKYIYVKINAPELLEKELQKLPNKGKGKVILLSSVTDPFQGMEAKYHLSEKCLLILAKFGFRGTVSILTKSPLVLKAIPVLKHIRDVEVGLTITSTDDKISRYFEKDAPPASARIETLRKLNLAGIQTYAFVGPLLPHFVSKKKELKKILDAIYKAGTRRLFIEHINLKPYIRERMLKELKGMELDFLQDFYSSQSKDYRKKLDEIIYDLLKEYDFQLAH